MLLMDRRFRIVLLLLLTSGAVVFAQTKDFLSVSFGDTTTTVVQYEALGDSTLVNQHDMGLTFHASTRDGEAFQRTYFFDPRTSGLSIVWQETMSNLPSAYYDSEGEARLDNVRQYTQEPVALLASGRKWRLYKGERKLVGAFCRNDDQGYLRFFEFVASSSGQAYSLAWFMVLMQQVSDMAAIIRQEADTAEARQ